ncbi:GRPL2 protein, partial [Turnix velox]|nr:GRPL2 protein [Turnix velox]
MSPWVAVVVVWLVLRAAAEQSCTLPSITDEAFVEDCVRVHNDLRSKVQPPASNMNYMSWDAALARTARAWANKCIFRHNIYLTKKHHCHPNFTSIGENIWVGNCQLFHVTDAIKSWHDEVRFYTFAVHKCTASCGHYTQVVWDASYKVGCAVTLCKEVAGIKNAAIFVCNYSPSGNLPRQPYIEGEPCSNCAKGDTCGNKLCNYSSWHPPWEFRIVCSEACIITVVIFRLVLKFLAFVAVYFLKKRFTNMHMST